MLLTLTVIFFVALALLFLKHKARVEAGEPGIPLLDRSFNRYLPGAPVYDAPLNFTRPLSRQEIEAHCPHLTEMFRRCRPWLFEPYNSLMKEFVVEAVKTGVAKLAKDFNDIRVISLKQPIPRTAFDKNMGKNRYKGEPILCQFCLPF
ncbi:hypothetical protein L596_025032 [Steinernema carpocapsae]|uniref:Uncharacterized protein n=1 Tax=Steinernema carpocapsae TaxID=34508 RepID=A0A4U5M6L6_STECR|nr:hypothetical protein L596_025032 [Steinernema carpocapsae]